MPNPYDVNSRISRDPDRIWAAARKVLPGRDRDELLVRPRYIFITKTLRIAYPGFLTWLKFVDPDRSGVDLEAKLVAYDRAKTRYEKQLSDQLKEFRKGQLLSAKIIIDQIDHSGQLVTFMPSPWNKGRDPETRADDKGAAHGEIHQGFLRAGSGSTIRISPDALNDTGENIMVFDQTLLHEMVHSMFAADGQESVGIVTPGWDGDYEFNATMVENVYRSEKKLRKMRASHEDDFAFWPDTENLLDHREIRPPPQILFGRFERREPDVFRQLALIPKDKATFNPFRDFKEEKDKKGKDNDD
jgi:hypothetical protein